VIQAVRDGAAESVGPRISHHTQAREAHLEGGKDLPSLIGAPVVDHKDFVRHLVQAQGLGDLFERRGDTLLLVTSRNNDT